ncbi:hypothetical protein H1R20_g4975, partial [Candolleomyces eurysporus]
MSSSSSGIISTPRRVVIDDTNSRVQYVGPWSLDARGTRDRLGNFGDPFQESLHGIVGSTGSFSFSYEGSSVKAYGTLNTRFDPNVVDPSWECYVDGQRIARSDSIPSPQNNWILCDYETNESGVHNLLVNVTSVRNRFSLDYIEYTPSPTDSAAQTFIRVDDTDPTLRFDSSWTSVDEEGGAHLTTQTGGTVTATFNGTGLQWYGYIPNNMRRGSSVGSYSIDGQPALTFILNGLPNERRNGPSQYNQLFFETRELSSGTHSIAVTYEGSRTPLTLQYLVIRNETSITSVHTSINPEPTTNSNVSSESASSSPPVASIVGAVLGTLIALVILILAFILGRRWYRRRKRPTIAPLPGFVKPSQPSAPLDIDAVPSRYSVELEERHAAHQSPRFHPLGHLRPPRISRQFNPEVSTSNAETDSILTAPRSSVVDFTPPPPHGQSGSSRGSQLDPYSAGYPYANMGLSEYQKLVAATKAEEARLNSRRRDPGYM